MSRTTGALAFDSADVITEVKARKTTSPTSFDTTVDGLGHGRHVMYEIVVASDRYENETVLASRSLEVSLTEVTVMNDSDPAGTGELFFELGLYDQQGRRVGMRDFSRDWGEGTYQEAFFEPIRIPVAGRVYRVAMQANDNDTALAHFIAELPTTVPPEGVTQWEDSTETNAMVVSAGIGLPSDADRAQQVILSTGRGALAFMARIVFRTVVTGASQNVAAMHHPPTPTPVPERARRKIPPIHL